MKVMSTIIHYQELRQVSAYFSDIAQNGVICLVPIVYCPVPTIRSFVESRGYRRGSSTLAPLQIPRHRSQAWRLHLVLESVFYLP